MGKMKELLIEKQQEDEDLNLSGKLDITFDELMQLDYQINEVTDEEGNITSYRIKFAKTAPKSILEKVKGIDDNNEVEFEPWELFDAYYPEEQFEAIVSNKHYYQRFLDAVESANKLNAVDFGDDGLSVILKRQTYISIIAALEAFLSETFVNLTNDNPGYFRKFVETFHDFKDRKVELKQIFSEYDKIRETGKIAMLEVIYHNLPKVSGMYEATFGIQFPEYKDIYQCVLVRHDLVHRNGKTKDGKAVTIDTAAVDDVIEKATDFANKIAALLDL